MKPKSINKWLICLIVLFFVQLACQYNVPPTLPRQAEAWMEHFFPGFAMDILCFHPAPMILEVTHPDSNMMSPTITGRINSGVSNLSILRLYTLKLMGCDKGYVKNNLVSEYDVKDILIGPDKFEWVIENAPIDEGAIFGVTLVGLSYDKSAVIETGMSNIWMNQTQKIELYVDPVETITRSGVISVSGKADIENLCLTLSRNGLSENETAVTSHGNWLFENVNITPGRNEFIIAAKQNYLGDVSNKTIVIDGFEIKMDWPFGKIENGVYKPAYQQGRLTSWYGWNHYHVRKGYGLHNGIDIAPHGMTRIMFSPVPVLGMGLQPGKQILPVTHFPPLFYHPGINLERFITKKRIVVSSEYINIRNQPLIRKVRVHHQRFGRFEFFLVEMVGIFKSQHILDIGLIPQKPGYNPGVIL